MRIPHVASTLVPSADHRIPDTCPAPLPDFAALGLAAIVESSDDAIVSKDLDGIVKSWNRAAEEMFGYTVDEAIGRSITLIIRKERRSEEDEVLARIRRNERIDHFETVRQRKDGALLDISLAVSPIRDKNGRPAASIWKGARGCTGNLTAEAGGWRCLAPGVQAEAAGYPGPPVRPPVCVPRGHAIQLDAAAHSGHAKPVPTVAPAQWTFPGHDRRPRLSAPRGVRWVSESSVKRGKFARRRGAKYDFVTARAPDDRCCPLARPADIVADALGLPALVAGWFGAAVGDGPPPSHAPQCLLFSRSPTDTSGSRHGSGRRLARSLTCGGRIPACSTPG
jgi:PAS domain S-box-containing protein